MAQRGVLQLGIIEALNVVEYVGLGLGPQAEMPQALRS